jgi:hypothetical protein
MCQECQPEENKDKVVVVGHGGQGKSGMANLLLANIMTSLGGYESYQDTVKSMKECGFFPKPQRNRPDLIRKKEQGRNERCNCGSGLKYKNCCGK